MMSTLSSCSILLLRVHHIYLKDWKLLRRFSAKHEIYAQKSLALFVSNKISEFVHFKTINIRNRAFKFQAYKF